MVLTNDLLYPTICHIHVCKTSPLRKVVSNEGCPRVWTVLYSLEIEIPLFWLFSYLMQCKNRLCSNCPFRYRSMYPRRVKWSMAAKHQKMGTWVSSLLAARGSFMKAILPMGSAWGSRTLTVTGSRFSRKAKNLTRRSRRNHKFLFDFLFARFLVSGRKLFSSNTSNNSLSSRSRSVKGFLSGWERPLLTSILPQMALQENTVSLQRRQV